MTQILLLAASLLAAQSAFAAESRPIVAGFNPEGHWVYALGLLEGESCATPTDSFSDACLELHHQITFTSTCSTLCSGPVSTFERQ